MKTKRNNFITSVIEFVISVIVGLLGLRFVLKLFGANEGVSFVRWIYEVSQPLLSPFRGIFSISSVEQGSYLEWSTVFAIIIYLILGYFLTWLVKILQNRPVENEDDSAKHDDHDSERSDRE